MFKAKFVCRCGFTFEETFQETEVTQAADLEKFYVRCAKCGEEAIPLSFEPSTEKDWRRRDWS